MPPYIAPERGAAVGFWGLPTSTLDWCEENYATTHYIAEFCKEWVSNRHDRAMHSVLWLVERQL